MSNNIMKNPCPSKVDTRPGWHLSLHVTEAETAPSQDIMIKMVNTLDTYAFTSFLHATNSELQAPTWPWNLDPGFSVKNV